VKRVGNSIIKTFTGNKEEFMKSVLVPNTEYPR
jgi:hypothetical protein